MLSQDAIQRSHSMWLSRESKLTYGRQLEQVLKFLQKQDEYLLEDIWTLLKAGRRDEACELCRSSGQLWRAATLCPFGGMDHFCDDLPNADKIYPSVLSSVRMYLFSMP
ncbi:hypothetical protein GIB67_032865 [Kingdonia uniflora]|uniref:Nuclear pore complex protein n=1 Tax=Kingdonia uniflora TaxID=39325 RepID=A0A7J7NBW7_9MAGN|nr:hypothetical protein GIB67_032865 [Kingdonia uniflora]